jgi:hypothetical protein
MLLVPPFDVLSFRRALERGLRRKENGSILVV